MGAQLRAPAAVSRAGDDRRETFHSVELGSGFVGRKATDFAVGASSPAESSSWAGKAEGGPGDGEWNTCVAARRSGDRRRGGFL